MKAAVSKSYHEQLTAHLEDHRQLFNRVSLELGNRYRETDYPTDKRLKKSHQRRG